MTSISISDIFTITYVVVDDWYQIEGVKLLVHLGRNKALV